MKKLILCFILLCIAPLLTAQTLYTINDGSKIYRINDDNTVTYLSTVSTQELLGDIAIAPSGEMYGVAVDILYRINPVSGEANYITQLPSQAYNALVCSSDYELYTIGMPDENLYKYNLLTND